MASARPSGHQAVATGPTAWPIVRKHDTKAFERYRTKDDVLAQLRQIEKEVLTISQKPA